MPPNVAVGRSTLVRVAFTERSAGTRDAILSAAKRLLAEQGYEAMTIRAVAGEVGVDPSMVMRYYGNKAGLFSAAVETDLLLEKVPLKPRAQLGVALTRHFLSRWEGDLSDDALALLLRSAVTNSEAADRMRHIFNSQVTTFVRTCVDDETDAQRRAGLIGSQLMGLALARFVLKLPPVVAMDVDDLVDSVAPVLQHYLTQDLGGRVGKAARAKKSAQG
ncbi:MAG: TetR/AcrR family transcriptional regulator [Mycolicibacterium mageritense]|nr:MAG: TetR/AcrR family transcriptional regulator [Mycolicibacterium mageritense]